MSVIVEHISRLTADFVRMLHQEHLKGIKIDLSQVSIMRRADEEFIYEVVKQKDLSFYKWMCNNFSEWIEPQSYAVIYSLCLQEYISFTVDVLPKLKSTTRGVQPTAGYLFTLSNRTKVISEASMSNTVRHAEWLIAMGRSRLLSAGALSSFVERLLMNSKEEPEVETARRLMLCCRMTEGLVLSSHLEALIRLGELHSVNNEPRVGLLLKSMAEAGLLSTCQCLSVMLDVDDDVMVIDSHFRRGKTYHYPTALVTLMWNEARVRSTYPINFAHDLLFGGNLRTQDSALRTFERIKLIDSETKGSISQFGLTIFSALLNIESDKIVGKLSNALDSRVITMMLNGWLIPPLSQPGSNPMLISEMTRMILCFGDNRLMRVFHQKITSESADTACWEVYIATANTIIQDITAQSSSLESSVRVLEIVKLVERGISIESLQLVLTTSVGDYKVISGLLSEAHSRLGEDRLIYENFIRSCLRRLIEHTAFGFSVETLLCYNIGFIDDSILKKILPFTGKYNWGSPVLQGLRELLTGYIDRNIGEYIDCITHAFYNGDLTNRCVNLRTAITGTFFNSQAVLVLGSQFYEKQKYKSRQSRYLINKGAACTIAISIECSTCYELLGSDVFVNEKDSHGIYYCGKCAAIDQTGISRATCAICLCDDRDLQMRVLSCGHSYCLECVVTLSRQKSSRCAICREVLEITVINETVTLEEVRNIFLREWTESQSNTRAAAERLKDQILVDSHNNESDSQSTTDED